MGTILKFIQHYRGVNNPSQQAQPSENLTFNAISFSVEEAAEKKR